MADAPRYVLGSLGIRRDLLVGWFGPPGQAPVRQMLETVNAGAGCGGGVGWRGGCRLPGSSRGPAGRRGRCWQWTPGRCAEPAWQRMPAGNGRASEITYFAGLLKPLELAGQVATADAKRLDLWVPPGPLLPSRAHCVAAHCWRPARPPRRLFPSAGSPGHTTHSARVGPLSLTAQKVCGLRGGNVKASPPSRVTSCSP